MKNKYFMLSIVVFALLQYSCNNVFPCLKGNKQVTTKIISGIAAYKEIENFTSADVILNVGSHEIKIEAESNLLDLFVLSVYNNKLTINTKDNKCFTSHFPIKIYLTNEQYVSVYNHGSGNLTSTVPLNSDLKIIQNTGSGDLSISGTSSGELNLNNQGSGNFKFSGNTNVLVINNLGSGDLTFTGKTNTFTINNDGSGNLKFSGNAEKMNLKNSGSGNVEALNMSVKSATISNAGSGNIAVNVIASADVSIMGSGNVRIKGKPVYHSKNVMGSGNLSEY